MSDMDPSWFSLLTAESKQIKVQREHLCNDKPGAAAVWGLYEVQHIIVWLWSYEMNVELESIYEFMIMIFPRSQLAGRKRHFGILWLEFTLGIRDSKTQSA
jgi:hypothetical protein